MTRRVDVGTKMYARIDPCDIDDRALVHGLGLLEFEGWVAGPGWKIRGDGQGNIVDGHGNAPYCSSRFACVPRHQPLSAKIYGFGVAVLDGNASDAETDGMDIGVSVGVIVGVGVALKGIQPL